MSSLVFIWGKPYFLIAFGTCQAECAFILTLIFCFLNSILFAWTFGCIWAIFDLFYPQSCRINYLCNDFEYNGDIGILRGENYFLGHSSRVKGINHRNSF